MVLKGIGRKNNEEKGEEKILISILIKIQLMSLRIIY